MAQFMCSSCGDERDPADKLCVNCGRVFGADVQAHMLGPTDMRAAAEWARRIWSRTGRPKATLGGLLGIAAYVGGTFLLFHYFLLHADWLNRI